AHANINCDAGDIGTTDGCNFTTGCTHQGIPNCAPRPNDTCANAQDLGTADANISSSTLGAHDDINPPASCSSVAGNGGPDVFYRFTVSATEWVTIDTFGSAINTVVYLLSDCNGTVVQLGGSPACNDDSGCNAPDAQSSAIAAKLNAGTYFIVVDSFGAAGAGAVNLHLHHSGPTCAPAIPISRGVATPGNTATDASSTNVLSPVSCGQAASGREQMFLFYLCPVTGTFSAEINTCGSSIDTVAYLRYGTCTGGDLGCNDDSLTCG